MKALDLEEGQKIIVNGKEATVSGIKRRVSFQVTYPNEQTRQWFVDGDAEIEVPSQGELL